MTKLSAADYDDETVRLVVREWAAANRGYAAIAMRINQIDRPLARALDRLLEEYRTR